MSDLSPTPEDSNPGGEAASLPPATATTAAGVFSRVSITHIVLIALALVFLWQWFDGHQAVNDMRRHLAEKIAEMEGMSQANQTLLQQSEAQVRTLAAKVTTLESYYSELQGQRAALEDLYNDLSASRDETALAEVEQLLLIAAQQLQLSRNVKAALIAMQSADTRLQRMDRPALDSLRRAIVRDMDKLRALPNVDVTGIGLQLDNLLQAIEHVPLRYQQHGSNQTAATAIPVGETVWQSLRREIREELGKLIRIENVGTAEIPLISPDQEFFLRENLRLRLMSARLALLSRDEENFKRELNTAQQWSTRYFDDRSNDGAQIVGRLKELAVASISIELPDVSASLQTVRNYRLSHEKPR